MKNATELKDDLKDNLDGIEMTDLERTLKERGRAGYEYAKDGVETAREALSDAVRPLSLKTVLGILAGTVVVVSAICLARRRRPRGNLLQRGIHEGARYAMLVPEGWHKAQKHAYSIAEDSARESVRLWNKLPRVRVEMK